MKQRHDRAAVVSALKHAAPYIRLFKGKVFVLKVGGDVECLIAMPAESDAVGLCVNVVPVVGDRETFFAHLLMLNFTDELTRPHLSPGDYVELAVSDTGTGIPSEVRPHLFEPFFTTKEVAAGSGLGLAPTYGIVTRAGGAIHVESPPGEGTRIRAEIPCG